MAWRDELRSGRFRDVAFHVESHSASGGRRLAVHEYPLRDEPYPEDLGRATRRWSLTLYVIGADYMSGRDALVAALEEEGAGTLVHPWLGTLSVQVEDFSLRESTREGGMAYFDVRFVQAGEPAQPNVSADTASIVRQRADLAQEVAVQDFAARFSVAGFPGWVRTAASDALGRLVGSIEEVVGPVGGVLDELSGWLDLPDRLGREIFGAALRIRRMLPSGSGRASTAQRRAAMRAMVRQAGRLHLLARTRLDAPVLLTPPRRQVLANQVALAEIMQQAAIIEGTRDAAEVEFESLDDAVMVRDDLVERLDEVALTAPDATYAAIQNLRAAVVADVTARGADLARVLRVTPAQTLPALVLAHRIHGDARREAELVARNNIRRPLAVPGGEPLEVLSDA